MARPLGAVRLRRTNSVTLVVGTPVTIYNLNNVTITSDPVANRESVLILTPMTRFYQDYWDNLLKLSYPHELITLGFILPKTKEGNAATAALQKQVIKTQKGPEKDRFNMVTILRQDFDPDLASHDKPLIAPNCFQRFKDPKTGKMDERPYDFNNWQDSEAAQKLAAQMGPDDILVEGYAELPTYRTLMAHLSDGGNIHTEMPIDGVGGATLLVKADVHRDGAMFPAFSFYHLIETEGFAKMAKRLGWKATGLPNYKVYHYNE
ncbi:unnamed protein product [Parascedosporium putredinis]|uniref:Uncharacterized protein n=1 Tax=Parascedosporium putredinis TaxID=1442378 RepID=A0A9P1H731_9PEZI|nr:unnamed protein product [Parascedosporium putredinis]CAI7998267.1 unnamed protein product [Parascedosporium putredinis]